jgi:hypothetical protein
VARSRTPGRAALPLAFALLAGLSSPEARAASDEAAVEACKGKSEGDACTFMTLSKPEGGGELERSQTSGTCQPGECCELDYSKGSPPETTCGTCLACTPEGSPTPPIPVADPDEPSSEPPRVDDQPPAPAGSDKPGCRIGDRGGPPVATSLLLLLGLLLRLRRDP